MKDILLEKEMISMKKKWSKVRCCIISKLQGSKWSKLKTHSAVLITMTLKMRLKVTIVNPHGLPTINHKGGLL